MHSVDIEPVGERDQTQRPFDLFLIFAGANIVATTLQVGASLPRLSMGAALLIIVVGALGGAFLVAWLAPVGSRLRVPSIVATRAALGYNGAQLVAAILFLTNFVWIALNNVIAASITSRLAGDVQHQGVWAIGFGVVATLIVLGGPRLVGYADRIAVPLLAVAGLVFTGACLRAPWPVMTAPAWSTADALRGFDVVFGYQTSWLLMFGDYSRYTRSGKKAAVAVLGGLGLTALWFIPLGFIASTIAQSSDPGVMVERLGLGWWGGTLVIFATLTTNFVNIYMSALALKSLRPAVPNSLAIWAIGGVGAGISVLSSAWLDQMANFTLVLAGLFVPVGGLLIAHFILGGRREPVEHLYFGASGEMPRIGLWSSAGMSAWVAGAVAFYAMQSVGGVGPSLLVSVLVYLLLGRRVPSTEQAGARSAT